MTMMMITMAVIRKKSVQFFSASAVGAINKAVVLTLVSSSAIHRMAEEATFDPIFSVNGPSDRGRSISIINCFKLCLVSRRVEKKKERKKRKKERKKKKKTTTKNKQT